MDRQKTELEGQVEEPRIQLQEVKRKIQSQNDEIARAHSEITRITTEVQSLHEKQRNATTGVDQGTIEPEEEIENLKNKTQFLLRPKVEAPKPENEQSCIIGQDIQISWKFSGIEKSHVT
ncbi:unnamed protein product [Didymodactylos carnosus]|uniref:Uncharacterized protein n=1 Tax=Didymodactylos carnosus TaxID=1234261 RepID=A0A814KHG9_9BILA|nr:unnamed protein product [Didymodactylos carnosus]CAF3821168.1 unnamed protein product [Didymodactylos carnosus]